MELLLSDISEKNAQLLGHILHLECMVVLSNHSYLPVWPIGPASHKSLRVLFGSLCRLEDFKWASTEFLSSAQEIEVFSAFKPTLSSITLNYCGISASVLVTLVNYFPNLECLELAEVFSLDDSHEEPLYFSRPPLKQLHIKEGHKRLGPVLNELSQLDFLVENMTIHPSFPLQSSVTFINRAVRAFGANATYLKVPQIYPNSTHSLPHLNHTYPLITILSQAFNPWTYHPVFFYRSSSSRPWALLSITWAWTSFHLSHPQR